MSLFEMLSATSGVDLAVLADPLEFGYRPVGLPRLWKRTAADLVGGQPAATWLDSSAVEADRISGLHEDAAGDISGFVSSVIVMAWTISGMSNSPARLATLVSEVTESSTGWSARDRIGESLPGQGFSIHLLGTLESPFGQLISNAHNVVCPIGEGVTVVVQLAVTATQEWAATADAIVLTR